MTQAINLANFANNLDSSGQMTPTTLNAPVPVSKGGTGVSNDADVKAYIGALLYPVGSIYTNAGVSTNPATLFGFGTWAAFGAGRVMVGFDSGNTLFDTLEETGGSADSIVVSHNHTATSIDSGHTHTYPVGDGYYNTAVSPAIPTNTYSSRQNTTNTTSSGTASITTTVNSTGSSSTNTNYQPYITVYMWKRTA